jgi:hypothetical protein
MKKRVLIFVYSTTLLRQILEWCGCLIGRTWKKVAFACFRILKVKLSLCFSWAPRHGGVLGSGGITPRILDLGTRWRWVVSFTPRLLYPQGKSPWYPLGRRLGGAQNRWREKFPAPAGNRSSDHPARSPALYHWAIPAPVLEYYPAVTWRDREKPQKSRYLSNAK